MTEYRPALDDKVFNKQGKLVGTVARCLPESDELIVAMTTGPDLTLSYSQVHDNGRGDWELLWDIDFDDVVEIAVEDVPTQVEGIQAVLNERGSRYGEFDTHAEITQGIKVAMRDHPASNWHSSLAPFQIEALEMIAHKIGRIVNGDPYYADSWIDIVGYAQLVVNKLENN